MDLEKICQLLASGDDNNRQLALIAYNEGLRNKEFTKNAWKKVRRKFNLDAVLEFKRTLFITKARRLGFFTPKMAKVLNDIFVTVLDLYSQRTTFYLNFDFVRKNKVTLIKEISWMKKKIIRTYSR